MKRGKNISLQKGKCVGSTGVFHVTSVCFFYWCGRDRRLDVLLKG